MDHIAARQSLSPIAREAPRWDYSTLAATYDLRVDYSESLVSEILRSLVHPGARVIDIGAGTGKLTVLLREFGLSVTAIEPNDAMRAVAQCKLTLAGTDWVIARAEVLPIASDTMKLACFGSSFNVVSIHEALDECARVLQRGGHWLALWNHRDLDDPLQREIEAIIHRHVPDFEYGARRESPTRGIEAHGAFDDLRRYERRFIARVRTDDWILAWQSHATLKRRAGTRIAAVLSDIAALVCQSDNLAVPYFTRAWSARRR